MANKYTRAMFINDLTAYFDSMDDSAIQSIVADGFTVDDFRGKLQKESDNVAKLAARPKTESAASKRNNTDAHAFGKAWNHDDVFTLADIASVIPTRTTAQSRVAVVNVLMRKNLIEKTSQKVDGHVSYKFVK